MYIILISILEGTSTSFSYEAYMYICEKKYLLADSLSSFSSMTGSFWILFLLRFAEGVFGNKLILLTGLEQNRDDLKVSFTGQINSYT